MIGQKIGIHLDPDTSYLRLSLAYFPGVHAGPMSLVSVCSAIYKLVSDVE